MASPLHFIKPNLFQELKQVRNYSFTNCSVSLLGKYLEEEFCITSVVDFEHVPVYPSAVCTQNSVSSSVTPPLTELPRCWIFFLLTPLSLPPFISSLHLFQYSQFCPQTSFASLRLLPFKHVGISSHAFLHTTFALIPFSHSFPPVSFSISLPHFFFLPTVSLDVLSLTSIHKLRLGLVPKPELIEVAAGNL